MSNFLSSFFSFFLRKTSSKSRHNESFDDVVRLKDESLKDEASILVYLPTSHIRDICWENIENMEHWAKRFIHETLIDSYGCNYLNSIDDNNNQIIKKSIRDDVERRMSSDPRRYPRAVDALTLENIIEILCNDALFNNHFGVALSNEYPCGSKHVKHFLTQIKNVRNKYAHNNEMSIREAERAICYSRDFIDCLRKYYQKIGREKDYNAPTFIKLLDSQGYTRHFTPGQRMSIIRDQDELKLRAGDLYRLEVVVDSTFSLDDYEVYWQYGDYIENDTARYKGNIIDIPITNEMVGRTLKIQCTILSKKSWHRYGSCDDFLLYEVKTILPPIEDSY